MRLKKGKLYRIRFHDHAIGEIGAIECEICAWYIGAEKHQYKFSWWHCIADDPAVTAENREPVGLVKKATISIEEIK